MIAWAAPRLCSAERCSATVSPGRRWCPTHQPCREPAPRTIPHRIARLILRDPSLTNRQLRERLDVSDAQIVDARRIVGIPDPGPGEDLLPWLDRALPAARARAEATCRRIPVEALHG